MAKPALHITTSLRIIRKHRNASSIDVAYAAEVVKELALRASREADERLVAELERRTGLSIAELAVLTDRWA